MIDRFKLGIATPKKCPEFYFADMKFKFIIPFFIQLTTLNRIKIRIISLERDDSLSFQRFFGYELNEKGQR